MSILAQRLSYMVMDEGSEAWLQGVNARESDLLRSDCPHTDPELVREWQQGYNVADVLLKPLRILHV